ncbi:unannotated protein [freshwater metagenome]|jgi:hypothetical protein|uniref:Unannotated protein n=1 Tax=freshwater metagenome TaxID=449393 RepID=A0A6J6DZK3_9ZZZZ
MSEILDKPEVARIYIDARGPRFGAVITTTVLAIALVTMNEWVLLAQALVFAIGAIRGPQFTPYGLIFKNFIKPRLSKEAPTEDVRPPKFAQSVGFIFALVGLVGAFSGAEIVFTVAVGFALGAAFLNAAFNYCLGCEMYLLGLRLIKR